MVTEQELNEAIAELEAAPSSFKYCFKLAVLYSLRDRFNGNVQKTIEPQVIHTGGDSEFLKAVEGKNWSEVLPHIDELLTAVRALQPQLYEAFLRRF